MKLILESFGCLVGLLAGSFIVGIIAALVWFAVQAGWEAVR